MADFTAKDVQALRQATGAGIMDAKHALQEAGGDAEAATKWLREKGLAKAAGRTDRDNSEGVVAVAVSGDAAAIVELKCETDFVAKSNQFAPVVQELAELVATDGESALDAQADRIDDLKVVLKENIELGRVVRVDSAADNLLGTYVHRQDGRGVNAVIVELAGGTEELAHDLAVHIAFTKPSHLDRESVPQVEIDKERSTLVDITRAEGKPEAALDKIVEGRLSGWFADRVVLEQKYVKDEKQTVKQMLSAAGATLVQFAQVIVGG